MKICRELHRLTHAALNMSRFVPAGSLDKPTKRGDEWLKAQQEIDENRKRKEAEGRQDSGKSLYEVLQANKGVSRAR